MENSYPAYLVGHIRVKDEQAWDEYRSAVPATLEPWQGQLMFRGKKHGVYSGEHDYEDTVVIQFPSQFALENWFNSAAYQALIPLREQAADMVLISYLSDV